MIIIIVAVPYLRGFMQTQVSENLRRMLEIDIKTDWIAAVASNDCRVPFCNVTVAQVQSIYSYAFDEPLHARLLALMFGTCVVPSLGF